MGQVFAQAFVESLHVLHGGGWVLLDHPHVLHGEARKKVSVEIVAVNQRSTLTMWQKSCLDGLEGVIFADDRDVAVSVRPERDGGDVYVQVTAK